MIHHISIAAQNPQHVAQVLAEIMQGQMAPFPPNPGSFMALALDEQGTMIEVYPADTELMPGVGSDEVKFTQSAIAHRFSATHVALSVPTEQAQIEHIAEREGWRVVRCNRDDLFEVIEFWIENSVMLELLTPQLAPRYVALMHPDNLKKSMAAFLASTSRDVEPSLVTA